MKPHCMLIVVEREKFSGWENMSNDHCRSLQHKSLQLAINSHKRSSKGYFRWLLRAPFWTKINIVWLIIKSKLRIEIRRAQTKCHFCETHHSRKRIYLKLRKRDVNYNVFAKPTRCSLLWCVASFKRVSSDCIKKLQCETEHNINVNVAIARDFSFYHWQKIEMKLAVGREKSLRLHAKSLYQ